MDVPLKPLLLVAGILLATTGVFVYRVALVGFGGLLGGAGGLLVGVFVGADLLLFIGAGLVGMVLGILLIQSAYRTAIFGAGALTGLAVGIYAAGASLTQPGTLLDPLLVVGVLAGIVAAFLLQKVIVLIVSAAWGATMVSIALAEPVDDPTNVQAVIDAVLTQTLLIVFVVGIGVQVGLWIALNYYGDDEESGLLGGLVGRSG